ncbi:MAG: hypothetical protein P8X86_04275 [Desulfofustis sp.]|jgi:hypothetical protein
MENIISPLVFVILGGLGLFLLYQAVRNWKFVLSYLLMPLLGMLAMAIVLAAGQFNDTIHPLFLGMAGVATGGLMGHWLALRKNWV